MIVDHKRDHREVPGWCPNCIVESMAHLARVSDHTFICDKEGCDKPANKICALFLRESCIVLWRFSCEKTDHTTHLINYRLKGMVNVMGLTDRPLVITVVL